MTLEADPQAGPDDVYAMLDAHFPADVFPRGDLFVNQATFNVRYRLPGDERERSLTFEVSFIPSGSVSILGATTGSTFVAKEG